MHAQALLSKSSFWKCPVNNTRSISMCLQCLRRPYLSVPAVPCKFAGVP